jgi:hypothetical protein
MACLIVLKLTSTTVSELQDPEVVVELMVPMTVQVHVDHCRAVPWHRFAVDDVDAELSGPPVRGHSLNIESEVHVVGVVVDHSSLRGGGDQDRREKAAPDGGHPPDPQRPSPPCLPGPFGVDARSLYRLLSDANLAQPYSDDLAGVFP